MPEVPGAVGRSWLWLAGSFVVAVLWAQTTWAMGRAEGGRVAKLVERVRSWRTSPWFLQVLRLLYYVGVPLAALMLGPVDLGGANERYLGIAVGAGMGGAPTDGWLDWAERAGVAAVVAVGAWVILALGWSGYRWALVRGGMTSAPTVRTSGWVLLREAAFHEVHWAFYRNAPAYALAELGGLSADQYWSVWWGLAPVAFEAVLNPAWRRQLSDAERAPALLQKASLAVVSAVLFGMTNSLLLAIAVHWGVSWGLQRWTATHPLPAREDENSTD
ncbi:MAG: hypothetical protein E3J64_03755 [Anaerolineales bacterium]|nr:MAG: hypothetical protein E3J64_03755 [Anaerolineales bacterium]